MRGRNGLLGKVLILKCFNHPEQEAVGVCTSCRKNICSNCAMEVGGKIVCKSCGQNIANNNITRAAVPTTMSATHKEPLLSVILSFFIPGLGQVYNGEAAKGLALFIGFVFSVILMTVACGFVTYLIIWLYAMYDAFVVADKINKGLIKI